MHWMDAIVEAKVQESMRKGEFDNLAGAGKPLRLDDDAGVPEELRVSYKLLRNAGMIPEEVQLRKDMVTLEELLACCRDDADKVKLNGELAVKKLRYQMLMNERGWHASAAFADYEAKIRGQLNGQ
ncbi:DnaJ family domain-containing protein [Paenibacillus hodogayensis]|uniref:DnaJ family domain-containing protein n=1 Tax=Paenibacillus hodogayensis TaxID=279208 RepID=A0ABV5W5H2_9BACL